MKSISFSLWGDDPKYTQGAIENAKIAKIMFPKWKCRFYVHALVPKPITRELKALGADVINVLRGIDTGMLWRFDPLLDKTIDRFIVRDTDGIITEREQAAVYDWIASKKSFHIIRDNPMHGTRIMGGMWGATKKAIEKMDYNSILENHDFVNQPNVFGYDQDFLGAKIYPLIKDDVCIHDDYHLFKDEVVRKIPFLRNGNHYIGEPIER